MCEAHLQASPRQVVTIPHRLRRSSLYTREPSLAREGAHSRRYFPRLYSKGFLIKTVSFGNNLSIFGRFSAQKAPTLQSVVHTLHTNYSTLCSACQYSAWFFVENRLVSFPELAKCAVTALLQKRVNLAFPSGGRWQPQADG